MSRILSNPKIFALTGALFVAATLFNMTQSDSFAPAGSSMTAAPAPVEATQLAQR